MATQKLMPDRISRTGEGQLQPDEIKLLKDKVTRQLIIYLPGYLLIAGGALFILIDAAGSFKTIVSPSVNLDEEETGRMAKLAPYFCSFVFLMSTIFFGKIFYQTILPILKDIKQKTKTLIYYTPHKSAMAFFNRYYLSTPLFNNQQVEVSSEAFNSIAEHEEICLEAGKYSLFVLGLKKGDKKIDYH